MAEFAQFQGEDPVLEATPVPSKASGHSAMADVFGEGAKVLVGAAVSVKKEQSQASMMNATAQANSVMTDTQIEMARDPGRANEIASNAYKNLDTVSQAELNSSDKTKLNFLNKSNKDKIKMLSAQTDMKQSKIQSSQNYWDAYNQTMPQYSEAIATGNFDQAEIIGKNILENARNAVLEGLMPESAYQNINKSMAASHARAEELHNSLQDQNATAESVHTASLSPLAPSDQDAASLPANHTTHSMTNHYSGQMTKQDIDNDIINWNITPKTMSSIMNQPNAEFAMTAQKILGSRQAWGKLNSNPAFPEVESRMNSLNNKSDISTQESSELQVYKNYMNDLNSGSFWKVQGRTTLGAQAVNDWNSAKDAANKHVSYELSIGAQAESKEKALAEIDNDFIDRGVSIAEGSHMDPRFITPVPENIMNKIQSGFSLDSDPSTVTSQLSRLKGRNIGYAGLQMKSGVQKEVITGIGFGMDKNMSPSFANDYILANQDHRDYSALKVEDTQRDATIRTQIASNLSDVIGYFSASGGAESAERINNFVNSGLNYVKLKAMQNGDLALDDLDNYVSEFTQEMGKGYNISNRRLGSINTSQIDISSSQQDTLQNYVYNEAVKNFMGQHSDDLNFQGRLSKTDINVYVDSTNHVVAKDQDGNSLYYQPYSEGLLNTATHHQNPVPMTSREKKALKGLERQRAPWYFGDQ